MAVNDRVIRASREADMAVHLVHDFCGFPGARRTIVGTSRLLKRLEYLANKCLYPRICGSHVTSNYGRSKYILEKKFLASPNNTVIRPGLVLGNGGLFGKIRKWAYISSAGSSRRGQAKLPVITVQKLCEEMLAIIESNNGRSFVHNIF